MSQSIFQVYQLRDFDGGDIVKAEQLLSVGLAMCLLALSTPAVSQGGFGALFKMPPPGQADGRYLSGNQIRTYVAANMHESFDMPSAVLEKAALMAQAKQFPIFAVIKSRCSTLLFNGTPMAKSCYLIAQMLNEHEVAKSKKGEPVKYVTVSEVIATRANRLRERAGIADTFAEPSLTN
ncbi:hypothetical protein [Sphingobium sp.]|uniref:hypothetical protein n=1 Tax=Sphingobium sp. TaxID=1912891 RepID=UPI0035C701CF